MGSEMCIRDRYSNEGRDRDPILAVAGRHPRWAFSRQNVGSTKSGEISPRQRLLSISKQRPMELNAVSSIPQGFVRRGGPKSGVKMGSVISFSNSVVDVL